MADEVLPRPGRLAALASTIELVFRRDTAGDDLCDSEMEVLGSVLPELIGELLQMSQDSDLER